MFHDYFFVFTGDKCFIVSSFVFRTIISFVKSWNPAEHYTKYWETGRERIIITQNYKHPVFRGFETSKRSRPRFYGLNYITDAHKENRRGSPASYISGGPMKSEVDGPTQSIVHQCEFEVNGKSFGKEIKILKIWRK